MKKKLKLTQFIKFIKETIQKDIKLNVEGKFNKKDKFILQIKSLEFDIKLAEELGFKPEKVEEEKIVIIKDKKPTLRESIDSLSILVLEGFNNVNKRLDSVEKDIKVLKSDIKAMKNTPTMKKELKNLNNK